MRLEFDDQMVALQATIIEREECAELVESLGYDDLAWAIRERSCADGLHDYLEGYCGVCRERQPPLLRLVK